MRVFHVEQARTRSTWNVQARAIVLATAGGAVNILCTGHLFAITNSRST